MPAAIVCRFPKSVNNTVLPGGLPWRPGLGGKTTDRLEHQFRNTDKGRNMRLTISICVFLLLLGTAAPRTAWAAEPPPGMSDAEFATLSEDVQKLWALAAEPYRPPWAPLPVFRGDVAGTALLHELLASPDAVSRARSAFLLGQIANPDSIKVLAERLGDPDRAVRVQSGIALACMGDARGIPVCAAALKSGPSWIRYYAAYGLWCANTPQAKDILRRAPSGRDKLVSQAVEGALSTPFTAPPPVTPQPPKTEASSKPPPDELWQEAADVLISESDWWWHQGDFEQVIRCREAALFLDPGDVKNYSGIAWLQWNRGRDNEAIRTLKRGVKAAPSDPDAHFELGFHYYRTNRYAPAEEPLRRAVELGGDHLARRAFAHCLEKLGKLRESLEQWEAIVAARPDDGAARVNLERVRKLVEESKGE